VHAGLRRESGPWGGCTR